MSSPEEKKGEGGSRVNPNTGGMELFQDSCHYGQDLVMLEKAIKDGWNMRTEIFDKYPEVLHQLITGEDTDDRTRLRAIRVAMQMVAENRERMPRPEHTQDVEEPDDPDVVENHVHFHAEFPQRSRYSAVSSIAERVGVDLRAAIAAYRGSAEGDSGDVDEGAAGSK